MRVALRSGWRAVRWSSSVAFLVGSLVVAFASPAEARECTNPLVSTCINSDTYWPNPGPTRFATVSGTETVARGQLGFGLVTTYQSRPLILRVASPGPGGSERYVVDDQVTGNFLFAYGVTDKLELDFALPTTFVQTGAGTSPLTGGSSLRDTAVRDLRFGLAYALVPRVRERFDASAPPGGPGRAWSLTARFTTSAPSGNSSDFAGERTAVFVPSLAADYRFQRAFFGAELSARLRPVTEFAGGRIGTQIGLGLGAGYDLLREERLSALVEARGYWNLPEQHDTVPSTSGFSTRPNGSHIVPAEWFVGLRSAPFAGGDVAFFGGGGGPIPTGDGAITTPRFRFLLGFTYAPLGRDSDHDGVEDSVDRCPNVPGVRTGESPGCPAPPPSEAPVDFVPPPKTP